MSVAAYPVHKPEAIYRINSSLENTKKESIWTLQWIHTYHRMFLKTQRKCLKETFHLEDPAEDNTIIHKRVLKRQVMRVWIWSIWSMIGTTDSLNKHPSFIKGRGFLDQLSDYNLLKKNSVYGHSSENSPACDIHPSHRTSWSSG
jgi:hypothetical protein